MPDLTDLPGVVSVTDPRTHHLEATYVDTPELTLLRVGVTLRRRTGGPDEGWHLKVPAGDGRDELRRPVGRDPRRPPVALTRLVTGWTRGSALTPVATIRTTREARQLLDADGDVVAELADDRVRGESTAAGATPVEWREWELELVGGDQALRDAAAKQFAAAGAPLSKVQRKLTMVLGEPSAAPGRNVRRVGPSKPAGRVLARRLAEQVDELLATDYAIRISDEQGVHRMRKACRRLRCALATYRPLVDRSLTDPVRDELRWLARSLGSARDAQVVFHRLDDLVTAEPRSGMVGPVVRRVRSTRRTHARESRAEVLDLLGSPRYFAMLRALENLVNSTPWRKAADRPATKVLLPRVHKDWERLKAQHAHAVGLHEADPAAYDEALHDVRKAAKRLRYACETLEDVWGKPAIRMHEAAQDLTEVLGERQDTLVSRGFLLDLAKEATAAGENAFTYGRLYAAEERAAVEIEAAFPATWAVMKNKKLRRWLS